MYPLFPYTTVFRSEVDSLLALLAGKGEGGVDLLLFLLLVGLALGGVLRAQRIGQAPAQFLGVVRPLARQGRDVGQQQRHHALHNLGIAPEHVEGLVEDLDRKSTRLNSSHSCTSRLPSPDLTNNKHN